MHFNHDPADAAFRAEVRALLHDKLPPELAARSLRGFHPLKDDMRAWTRILHAKGWSAPHWPVEFGGTGWSPLRRHIFEEECFLAGAPPTCTAAFSLVAPVLFTFGSEAQQRRHLPRILAGDEFWGQGFSEPNAGSDLASLRTSARRVAGGGGDHYVVSGQKIWTTEAHYADMLFCLVRTEATAKPQHGISFLLIDAKAPGVTIRPIISIDGAHSLNEVFLDDVRVPAENLVGEEGKGWSYAKFLLENERAFSAEVPRNKRMFARLKDVAARERRHGKLLIDDPVFATRLAQLEVELGALEFLTLRALSEHGTEAAHRWPGGSVLHVRGSELQQKVGELLVEALGDCGAMFYAELEEHAPGDHAPGIVADFLYRRAVTIYGGSNEIQRNLISRHLLRH
jgi:alkylation response protein AidB-like acyl-CoA dehydrogenase